MRKADLNRTKSSQRTISYIFLLASVICLSFFIKVSYKFSYVWGKPYLVVCGKFALLPENGRWLFKISGDVLTKSPPIAFASPSSFESFVFLASIGSQHIKTNSLGSFLRYALDKYVCLHLR